MLLLLLEFKKNFITRICPSTRKKHTEFTISVRMCPLISKALLCDISQCAFGAKVTSYRHRIDVHTTSCYVMYPLGYISTRSMVCQTDSRECAVRSAFSLVCVHVSVS